METQHLLALSDYQKVRKKATIPDKNAPKKDDSLNWLSLFPIGKLYKKCFCRKRKGRHSCIRKKHIPKFSLILYLCVFERAVKDSSLIKCLEENLLQKRNPVESPRKSIYKY